MKRKPTAERPTRAVYAAADQRGRALAIRPDALGLSFDTYAEAEDTRIVGGVAVIDIEGPLEHRDAWWWDSYESISERFALAIGNPDAKTILLRIDSPGGMCSGLFETVKSLRAMKSEAGKPVIAYVDEGAYSAAYALACIADEVYLPEAGGVGSVGVITSLVDVTKANAEAGVRVEVVTSGARKADGNPDVPLTDATIARMQERVDGLAALFYGVVSESRGMSVAAVKALEAGAFYGPSAVAAGLADAVMSLDDVLDAATRLSSGAAARASQPMGARNMKTKIAAQKAVSDAEKALAAAKNTKERHALGAALTRAKDALAALEAADEGAAKPTPTDDEDDSSSMPSSTSSADEEEAAAGATTGLHTKDRLFRMCQQITGKKTLAEVMGALDGMSASLKHSATLAERVEKLEGERRAEKVNALIEEGVRAGKLTPAQREWAATLGPKRLAAFLECAPVLVSKASDDSRVAPVEVAKPAAKSGKKDSADLLGVDRTKAAALSIVGGKFTPERAPKAH